MERLISFETPQLTALVHIAIAMLLGGIIGFERERAHKPAGLRTHMLVAAAAAFLVILGDVVIEKYDQPRYIPGLRGDPLRILSAVITGVSFLGAGTIIRRAQGETVEGLTTAASLLMVAAIGASVALGQSGLAVGVTALVFATLHILTRLEQHLRTRETDH